MSPPETRTANRQSRATKAPKVLDKAPTFTGWQTSDEDEIKRRVWRGSTDIATVTSLETKPSHFGDFQVHSHSGMHYPVEIRSLSSHENSCGCLDFETNGLGTCKHIEGVLLHLRKQGRRAFAAAAKQGSPRVEIYFSGQDTPELRIQFPQGKLEPEFRKKFETLTASLELNGSADLKILRDIAAEFHDTIRVSPLMEGWLEERRKKAQRIENRDRFLQDVAANRHSLDMLHHPLLPYQVDGMLHLAFSERALLADEMGLGKTVQAIAACELLRRTRGIRRVLVVSPVSLKAEWEEQIARFSDLSSAIVFGPRHARLERYRNPVFFTLSNYEQILIDEADINQILRPDVIILDEAQRIKNWQTKTARAVKRLRGPFAFVLTGTPLENRIDEIYSIVQYLDPKLIGPLFRFNRDFYELDERGRPVGYKNLDELARRLKSVMLRRRKDDVEDQLPGRTVTNYFVAMTAEQRLRYEDYQAPVQRILHMARNRPLRKEEFERLQRLLGCMRMVCDTPYILDPSNRDCPKLEELEPILNDLLADEACKILVFSEWVRMLELVRELAVEIGVEFAWHTGSVPQNQRRAEINRFKKDPACRLFLSSESGGVGLNLQVADTVINMDLPWNPAKLEQRIARAWRKHQKRPVGVINLVCEDSIEHRMVYLLEQKQGLADGVLDGRGDLDALKMPSGRAAFLERMEAVMKTSRDATEKTATDPALKLRDTLLNQYGDDLLSVELLGDTADLETLLVVLKTGPTQAREAEKRLSAELGLPVQVLDPVALETIRRLEAAGILRFTGEKNRSLYRSSADDRDERQKRRDQLRKLADAADHKLRMAALLLGGGFETESLAPVRDAAALAIRALVLSSGKNDPGAEETLAALVDNFGEIALIPVSARHRLTRLLQNRDEEPQTDGHRDSATEISDVRELVALARSGPGLPTPSKPVLV